MLQAIQKIENRTYQKYGYEHKVTFIVCWITHFLRKLVIHK